MTLDEYQQRAVRTAIYPSHVSILYPLIGLSNEAGEALGKMKKILRGDKTLPETHADLVAEVGDVLWYVAAAARDLGMTLEEVAKLNIDKLESRALRNKIMGDGDNR